MRNHKFSSFDDNTPVSSTIQSPERNFSHATLSPNTKEELLKRVSNRPFHYHKERQSPFLESSSGSSVTHSSNISSSCHTVSLLHAAAKSVLDNSPGASCDQSDDEGSRNRLNDEDCKSNVAEDLRNNSLSSPALRSLQKEVLPAIPEEQDRKRFIGCLAAVLSSLYTYDIESDVNESFLQSKNSYKLSFDEQDFLNEIGESDEIDPARYSLQPSFSEYSDSERGLNRDSKIEQPSCIQYGSDLFHDSMKDSPLKSTQDRIFRQNRKFDWKSTKRHRKRRYELLSNLLLNSAELMHLEKNQGKCFLPMLADIMKPRTRNVPNNQSLIQNTNSMDSTSTRQLYQTVSSQNKDRDDAERNFLKEKIDEIEHLRPFLESMTPGAGIRCLAMFLIQHLLHSEVGYDARIRHAVKTVGVLLIMYDMTEDPESYIAPRDISADLSNRLSTEFQSDRSKPTSAIASSSNPDLRFRATRFFESIEHAIAANLLHLSQVQSTKRNMTRQAENRGGKDTFSNTLRRHSKTFTSDNILRGLKIGGTAVAAGALFAVTGGLAAPGIAAGVAAIAGGTAVTAAAAAILTSTVAVTAIFGVGGGGLAAYKMQRRTIGLTEFEFVKETGQHDGFESDRDTLQRGGPEAELFSTVCLSGWLRDECDFQRPWGVTPSQPRIRDRLELLERFYSVHSPEHVPKSAKILAIWKGQEKQLWNILRQKYGRDPNHLLPLDHGARLNIFMTHEQNEIVGRLFVELGYSISMPGEKEQRSPMERILPVRHPMASKTNGYAAEGSSINRLQSSERIDETQYHGVSYDSDEILAMANSNDSESRPERENSARMPKHISTVWDYQSTYGGELYTVRWESELLTDLCDSVADLAFDVISGGTRELLKFTALSTLISAMAWPYALINAANIIDSTWTLGVERADAAGRELARSLLFSTAGNRPITLVGFSFGARAIYSCLKELARYQEKWEDYREKKSGSCVQLRSNHRLANLKEDSDAFYQTMREPASIVEDIVLMGLPNHLSISSWKACRRIVSGRLVHCFSQKDLILSLMFQIKKFGLQPVCGTCAVDVDGVENVDVTDLIAGHEDYCLQVSAILKRIRHCEPFPSCAPSHIDSEYNADDVAREVAKLGIK